MDWIGKTTRGILAHSRVRLRGNERAQKYAGIEPPLRAELFSADQMEQHGQTLAGSHQLRSGRPRDRLLKRLAENEGVLNEPIHYRFSRLVDKNSQVDYFC